MSTLLVHIHTGPENPTKATLGCLVALTAAREGQEVSIFMAGDGVHLLAPAHAHLEGVGTGKLAEHLAGLKEAGVSFVLSGMSSKARGYDEGLLAGYDARFGMPSDLVALATKADTVLCY